MKELIKKYRTNRLTSTEIEKLKERSALMGDEELSDVIFEDWKDFEPSSNLMDLDAKEKVYTRLVSQLGENKDLSISTKIWKFLSVAAIIAVPILLCVSIYLYSAAHNRQQLYSTVVTGNGENARVKLPDGSMISLNDNSEIEYDTRDFDGKTARSISFSGEGLFNIAKAQSSPFVINASGLEVIVKGTTFNLQTSQEKKYASLFLMEGSVVLKSTKTESEVLMEPNEKAVLNYDTGEIVVSTITENDNPLAWQLKKLYFKNATMDIVKMQMEEYFKCKLEINDSIMQERFTGLIPLNTLEEANSVIEEVFNTRVVIK